MDNLALNTKKPIEGEEKTFPDGSLRKLEIGSNGVNRWMRTGTGEGEDKNPQATNPQPRVAPVILEDEKPLEFINREDWLEYNKYLTADNPFLYITSYEEGVSIWLDKVYEYDGRRRIYLGEQQLYEVSKQKEIDDLETLYVKINNQFLALQMYKICALIQEIEKYDHTFDYDAMLEQGASWKDFIEYLETAKEDE